MSTRIYGGARGALLDEDDDWFATPQQRVVELDHLQWENELEWELREPDTPDLGRRQAAIVIAAVVAVLLVFAGILIGRATKHSTTRVVTAPAAAQTQTPAATSAGDNTAGTGTPSSAASTNTPTTSTPSTSANTPSTSSGTPSAGTTTPSTTPSTSAGTPSSTAVPTGTKLRLGDKGDAVTALQTALTTLGYASGTADGTFGAATAQAVTAFQTAKTLTADGVAGAKTLAAINAALASG
jgi:Putative peptidoglycan binding domain